MKSIILNRSTSTLYLGHPIGMGENDVVVVEYSELLQQLPEMIRTPVVAEAFMEITLQNFSKLTDAAWQSYLSSVGTLTASTAPTKMNLVPSESKEFLLAKIKNLKLKSTDRRNLDHDNVKFVYQIFTERALDKHPTHRISNQRIEALVSAVSFPVREKLQSYYNNLGKTRCADVKRLAESGDFEKLCTLVASIEDLKEKSIGSFRCLGYYFVEIQYWDEVMNKDVYMSLNPFEINFKNNDYWAHPPELILSSSKIANQFFDDSMKKFIMEELFTS